MILDPVVLLREEDGRFFSDLARLRLFGRQFPQPLQFLVPVVGGPRGTGARSGSLGGAGLLHAPRKDSALTPSSRTTSVTVRPDDRTSSTTSCL